MYDGAALRGRVFGLCVMFCVSGGVVVGVLEELVA